MQEVWKVCWMSLAERFLVFQGQRQRRANKVWFGGKPLRSQGLL